MPLVKTGIIADLGVRPQSFAMNCAAGFGLAEAEALIGANISSGCLKANEASFCTVKLASAVSGCLQTVGMADCPASSRLVSGSLPSASRCKPAVSRRVRAYAAERFHSVCNRLRRHWRQWDIGGQAQIGRAAGGEGGDWLDFPAARGVGNSKREMAECGNVYAESCF